jgi:hypothetical protein
MQKQVEMQMHPRLVIKMCELKKYFNHLPVPQRLGLEEQLRRVLHAINATYAAKRREGEE